MPHCFLTLRTEGSNLNRGHLSLSHAWTNIYKCRNVDNNSDL